MPRANSSVPRRKKHKKIIKQAKGYFGTRKSNYRTAKMQFKEHYLMLTEIEDKKNVIFEDYGLFVLMLQLEAEA